MNKNILLKLAVFLSIGVAAQSQKVGVNKDNPDYTLDIEGSMRIKDLGANTNNAIPLAWNPTTGQVVKGSSSSKVKDFYNLTYTVNVSQRGEDWANWVNLGIDANKYYAVLTQANLVTTDFSYDNPDAGKVYIPTLLADENNASSKGEAYIHPDTTVGYSNSSVSKDGIWLGRPVEDTKIDIRNGTYHFYGDYPAATPTKGNKSYAWRINVFIMKKSYLVP